MKNKNTQHSQYKHGMFGTRPYSIWRGMLNRCQREQNNNYKNYGGRGIKVCQKWRTFEGFWKDMEEGYAENLTIDRKNNNGNYNKNNCRWVTQSEQSRNTRRVPKYLYKGRELTRPQLAKIFGVNINTLIWRMSRGQTIQEAIRPVNEDQWTRFNPLTIKVTGIIDE